MQAARNIPSGPPINLAARPYRRQKRELSFQDYRLERARAVVILQRHDFDTDTVAAVLQISPRLVQEVTAANNRRLREGLEMADELGLDYAGA